MSTRRMYESRMTVRLLLWGRDLDDLVTRLYLQSNFPPEECDELVGILYVKELLAWECLHGLVESSDEQWAWSKAVLEKRAADLQSVFGRLHTVLGAEQSYAHARFTGNDSPGIREA